MLKGLHVSKATIKDVARVADVSLKTVSRVINNEPTVRETTRRKVRAIINELNYQPDVSARSLRGSTSYAVGLVYDNPNPYYVVDIQNGVLQACREMGYSLQIHPCNTASEDIVEELCDLVRQSRLAGLVLAPPISEDMAITDALSERGIHFVRIISAAKQPQSDAPGVYVNDRAAANSITRHLIDKGHRDIAFLAGEEAHNSTVERREGYKAALAAHGLPVQDTLTVPGVYSFGSGFERTVRLMQRANRPTAIFGCNDEIAAGALAAVKANGMRVPDDVAIAGFENSPFSRQSHPQITTASQSTGEIAHQAMMLLIAGMRPHSSGGERTGHHAEFIPQLIVRPST